MKMIGAASVERSTQIADATMPVWLLSPCQTPPVDVAAGQPVTTGVAGTGLQALDVRRRQVTGNQGDRAPVRGKPEEEFGGARMIPPETGGLYSEKAQGVREVSVVGAKGVV